MNSACGNAALLHQLDRVLLPQAGVLGRHEAHQFAPAFKRR